MNRLLIHCCILLAALAVVGAPSFAAAQPVALGVASVSLGYERPFGERPAASVRDAGFVQIRLGGLYGTSIAYAAAFSIAVGGALEGGFVVRSELFPVGLGLRLGELGYVAVMGGLGVEGMTAIGAAFRLPVDLRIEIDLADAVRLLTGVRATWLFGHDVLDAGAPDFERVDEIEATLGLRIGSRTPQGSSGYHVSFTGGERQGARYLGVLVGVALSAAGSR